MFVDDPSVFLYATALHNPMASSRMNSLNTGFRSQQHFNSTGNNTTYNSPSTAWDRHTTSTANTNNTTTNTTSNTTNENTSKFYIYIYIYNDYP